jgi:hypothetical protein
VYTNEEEFPNVIVLTPAHFIDLHVELLQIHKYCVNMNHAYCIYYKSNSNVGLHITKHSRTKTAGIAATLRKYLI